MTVKLEEKRIKSLIKEGVREAMSAQIMKLGALLTQDMSEKEQREIMKLYRKPSRKISRTYQAVL